MRFVSTWAEARLLATEDLTPSIRRFDIAPAQPFTAVAPGAHIQVQVLINNLPETRHYSVLDAGSDGVLRIAVKRLPDSRGGSAYMWGLKPGAALRITAPHNQFELSYGRPDYLLLAGGIGITPIQAMARTLALRGDRVRLLYAARSRRDLAFVADLQALLGDRLQVFVSDEGQRLPLADALAGVADGGEVYLCGPVPMLEAARERWATLNRPAGLLRFETFGGSGPVPTRPFTVRVPRLGLELVVPPEKTLLAALQAAGVDMIYDCLRGECGLCALDVLGVEGGEIDHRDVFFSPHEKAANDRLCACVSRASGGCLTLDTADRPY